jgi:hypothetical protein
LGWLLALTVMVTAAVPHMSFASHALAQSESAEAEPMHQNLRTTADCHTSKASHEQTGGCAAMTAHCSLLLPQVTLLPRQTRMQISLEYGFGVVAPYDLASVSETPPPRI